MGEVVIVQAIRTPVGRYGGALKDIPVDHLAALTFKEVMNRSGLPGEAVDEVILGWGMSVGRYANLARVVALRAGLPVEVPAYTVNRNCASGLQALALAAEAIQLGTARFVLAGGAENMTRMPYIMEKPSQPYQRNVPEIYEAGEVYAEPEDIFGYLPMGITAENVASRFNISREEQDAFALASHQKAVAAQREGAFAEEIVPVTIPLRRGETTLFEADESPRPDTSLEKLARLQPVFKEGGTVTAGNSCPLNDAAAALLLMDEAAAREYGLQPLAYVRGWAAAAVDPAIMGTAPVPATRKLLDRTGLALEDIDIIELNEAFASQAIYCIRELGLAPAKVNPLGGAIALGHPIGCTGAKLTTTLVYELKRSGKRFGLVTMCVGGGQGMALLLERA